MGTSSRIPLIFNPQAGRKRATRRIANFLQRYGEQLDILPTERPRHARHLAQQAADAGAKLIIAAGGDGTVHEVASGILHSQATETALGVLPIGSANDFAWSLERESLSSDGGTSPAGVVPAVEGLGGEFSAPSKRLVVDVGLVRTPNGKHEYFVESLGTGLSGRVTVTAREIRWLQGMPLYMLATLKSLWSFQHGPMMIWVDDVCIADSTLLFSVMLGQREGSFQLAPQAKMSDGLFDWVQGVEVSTWQALRLLPQIALRGLPKHRQILTGKCRRVRLQASFDLDVHADGELLCVHGHGIRELELEIIPSRLAVHLFRPS